MSGNKHNKGFLAHSQRYILTGILTAIPVWITWVFFEFILKQLTKVGLPWVQALLRPIENQWPNLSRWITEAWFQNVLAIVIMVVALYLLGWVTSQVIGRKLLNLVDYIMQRIPLVKKVYGATKQLIDVIQERPEGVDRVVLIEFPTPEMKAVGFVMRIMKDDSTGEEVAAVYVPTTPNPTSGYLEIVPVKRLVETDWTMDEAMTFIISGGAVAPDNFRYRQSTARGNDNP